jgi:hypothetical protein
MIRPGRGYEPVIDDDYEEEGDEDKGELDGEAFEEYAEEQADAKLIDVENSVTTKKNRKKMISGTGGPKWKSMEDECLIDMWMHVISQV